MTNQEKQITRRMLISLWELLKADTKTEAIKAADEMVDVMDKLDVLNEKR